MNAIGAKPDWIQMTRPEELHGQPVEPLGDVIPILFQARLYPLMARIFLNVPAAFLVSIIQSIHVPALRLVDLLLCSLPGQSYPGSCVPLCAPRFPDLRQSTGAPLGSASHCATVADPAGLLLVRTTNDVTVDFRS